MAVISIKSFKGIAPRVPARYLGNDQAQVAFNCPVFNGSLQPIKDVGASFLTLPKSGVPKTIYRYGQDLVSDTQYWFHWTSDVDVCRSQIAGDTSEWTFFTGDGAPKATHASLALSGTNYPAASRTLGLPAPTTAVTAAVSGTPTGPIETAAEIVLTSSVLQYVGPPHWSLVEISTTDTEEDSFTAVGPSSSDLTDIETSINASAAAVTATADLVAGTITITSDAVGESASLFVRYTIGDQQDADSTLLLEASPDYSATGTSDTVTPRIILEDNEIGSISAGDKITIRTETSTVFSDLVVPNTMDENSLATWLASNAGGKVSAAAYGSCVVISPGTEGSGASGTLDYTRKDSGNAVITEETAAGSEDPAPAELLLQLSDIVPAVNGVIQITAYGAAQEKFASDYATIFDLDKFVGTAVEVSYYGTVEPFAILKTTVKGSNTTLRYRVGSYSAPTSIISASGVTTQANNDTETRVYTYTWVATEAGYTMESAPAPASGTVDVEIDGSQTVDLTGFDAVPGGAYNVTGKRIYRSVNGVYLFVGETSAAASTYTDSVAAASLGEELPSLYWSPPPSGLEGLTSLPNGMVAGFSGRDVYFAEPYRPHAWPETYMQTVDYPVVGLGRMDTTLAVLTTGVPYLMQGSHPDNIAVVKSDLEQACVSKRSIVSFGSAIVYAAPDGLMMLSPGGSKIITEDLFDYRQWQTYFGPESIHAYAHDNQYIGFYDNGTAQGGFIIDMPTRQFILHDIYATAGFQDTQRDKLFLALADKSLCAWDGGAAKNYTWRSKRFTMPQVKGFSCAQVEAEEYPVTLKVYADGTLIHTQTVQSRNPFRLPAKVGRDWELEVDGVFEVFAVSMANSMTELGEVAGG